MVTDFMVTMVTNNFRHVNLLEKVVNYIWKYIELQKILKKVEFGVEGFVENECSK